MVSQQPVSEFPVNGAEIVKQQILVVVHELFLDGPIEPFSMGVHVWGPRIGPPMRDATGIKALLEVPLELGAVVGEDEPGGGGGHWSGQPTPADRRRPG